ncbi:hypothetical protein AYI68_g3720, partial [Smittium mucronatum]
MQRLAINNPHVRRGLCA